MFLQSVGTIERVSNLALKFNNNKKLSLGMYSFGLGTVPVLSGAPGLIQCIPNLLSTLIFQFKPLVGMPFANSFEQA